MMKSNLRKALVAFGALGILVAAGAAYAHGPGRGKFMQHMIDQRISKAEDLINATPAQRQAIDAAKTDIVTKLKAHGEANKGTHGQFLAMLTADTFDAGKAQALADAKAAEISAIAKELIPDFQAIHDTLTPAQRQTLAAHIAQMKAEHQEHQHEEP